MKNSADVAANILVRDRDDVVHRLSARPGFTLMEILRDAGLPVAAVCGGNCLCATCHIYIDEAWQTRVGEPQAEEASRLEDTPHVTPASRFSCQIEYTTDLSGLELTLAPE
jgi:ferredoxin, 2Fe-2S